ncbi:MAG TPA: hypothetical protein VFH43_03145 [Candidatus Kapabacteria bacterium]|nr:hypothetical protein [Candidatus Kapabacteria bacterium]
MEYKEFYSRNLPHLQSFNASYFVTTRLKGTLPKEAISRLMEFKDELEKAKDPRAGSHLFKYLDDCLDQGFGVKWLEDPRIRSILWDELLRMPENAHMHCFCIMPNHIHLLLTLGDGAKSLERIMRSIKALRTIFQSCFAANGCLLAA